MEDLDILFEDDLEGDFIHLVSKKWPKDMFEMSAKAMLGDTWAKDGEQILKEHAPEHLKFFKEKYANESSTGED